jgi:hypothetical protein
MLVLIGVSINFSVESHILNVKADTTSECGTEGSQLSYDSLGSLRDCIVDSAAGSLNEFVSNAETESVGSSGIKSIQTLDFVILALSELRESLLQNATGASASCIMHEN